MKTIRNLLIAAALIVAGNVCAAGETKGLLQFDTEMIQGGATQKLIIPKGQHIAYLDGNDKVIGVVHHVGQKKYTAIEDAKKNRTFRDFFVDTKTRIWSSDIRVYNKINANMFESKRWSESIQDTANDINTPARKLCNRLENMLKSSWTHSFVTIAGIAVIAYAGYKLTKSFKKDKDNSDQNDTNENVELPTNAA